jgi:hypothetical protein
VTATLDLSVRMLIGGERVAGKDGEFDVLDPVRRG